MGAERRSNYLQGGRGEADGVWMFQRRAEAVRELHRSYAARAVTDKSGVRHEMADRDGEPTISIPWAMQMKAVSTEEPSRLVQCLTGAILGCGGWVLSRGRQRHRHGEYALRIRAPGVCRHIQRADRGGSGTEPRTGTCALPSFASARAASSATAARRSQASIWRCRPIRAEIVSTAP
jgi:hypothetical protein